MNFTPYIAGSSLPLDSSVYIERDADFKCQSYLRQQKYIRIIEPRQQGKTSLAIRLHQKLNFDSSCFSYIDAEGLSSDSEMHWYNDLSYRLVAELNNHIPLANLAINFPQNSSDWRGYLFEICRILKREKGDNWSWNIVVDETGSIPPDWGEKFFCILREIHNIRHITPGIKNISFIFMGAFNPNQMIRNKNNSPFNVAEPVYLNDLDIGQLKVLVKFLNLESDIHTEITNRLYYWTGGQPYISQKICAYLWDLDTTHLSSKSVDDTVERFFVEDINHLHRIFEDLETYPDYNLIGRVSQVINSRVKFFPSTDETLLILGHVIGLIKADQDGYCKIRNRIYERALHERFPQGSNPMKPIKKTNQDKNEEMDVKRGLQILKRYAESSDWQDDFDILEAQILQCLQEKEQYGYDDQGNWARIMSQLNKLSRSRLNISFNDLCLGKSPHSEPLDQGYLTNKEKTLEDTLKPNILSESILIVTVTKVEAQAVLQVFSEITGKSLTRKYIGGKTYHDLGTHSDVPIFMVQSEMGSATPGGALLTVRQAIADLKPQAAIMCGIAFGAQPDRQQLGDILIAKQLEYYDPQKIDAQLGQISRGDRATASERLLDHFRSADNYWKGSKTHFGLVLSGEKLVNDLTFRNSLLKNEPEAIGGEMEGAGLYAAARDAKVDWILIKAICDWADGNKNNHGQILAAKNAADFVSYVIQLGGWNNNQ